VSLGISVDRVQSVLLADGWHDVAGASFNLGTYEYFQGDQRVPEDGRGDLRSTGFGFRELSGNHLYGPLTAVLAVRIVRQNA
jgi:hypothetical protein